jgi:hypothetical protein
MGHYPTKITGLRLQLSGFRASGLKDEGSEQILTYFRGKYFSFAIFGSTTADPASSQASDIHK